MDALRRQAAGRRLALCLFLSAAVIFVAMSLTDFSFDLSFEQPVRNVIDVDLEAPAPNTKEPEPEMPASTEMSKDAPEQETVADEPVPQDAVEQDEAVLSEELSGSMPLVDWHAEMRKAVAASETLDAEEQSFMGGIDAKLQAARARYYPSPDSGPRPVWENIEKDQLGRSLLWHGDCYRVLADPNVMNLYVFETFTQFIVFCQPPYEVGRELPWVAAVVARYDYLQDPTEIDTVGISGDTIAVATTHNEENRK